MRISEITFANKTYIRVSKGKKKLDIPVTPKTFLIPRSRTKLWKFAFVGCESIRVNYKGKTVKLNWTFNHNKMTLFCSSGHKAYSWKNVKVANVTSATGEKEQIILCKREFGDETERRKYKRVPLIKNVTITQGGKTYQGSTVDISYGGMGIKLKQNVLLTPKEPLNIQIDENTKVKARLVRTVFKDDGTELLGCYVSKVFRLEMMRLVGEEEAMKRIEIMEREKEKATQAETDSGWYESNIRWH